MRPAPSAAALLIVAAAAAALPLRCRRRRRVRRAMRGRRADPDAAVCRPDRAGGALRTGVRALRDRQHRHRGHDADRRDGRVRDEPVPVRAVERIRDGPGVGGRRQPGRCACGGGRASGALALLHAVVSIRFRANQIVSGTVVNILAIGITGYGYRQFLAQGLPPGPGTFPPFDIPVLADIPVLGAAFFSGQKPIACLVPVLVVAIHFVLFHTPWGLRTRAVGENPRAADTLGIDVCRVRYLNVSRAA